LEAEEKPFVALTLSLISGGLILFFGLLYNFNLIEPLVHTDGTLFVLLTGLISGIMVLAGSIFLYINPEHHTSWGILIAVFSILSIFSLGGIVIGLICGILGGFLGIIWNPEVQPPSQPVTRFCPQCGRVVTGDIKFCPHCGKPLK
jgi:hypothetical protein